MVEVLNTSVFDAWLSDLKDRQAASCVAKALSKDGNPTFDTVLKVMRALGLRFGAKAVSLLTR
jgi:putative component of toxin-antitoxin plasmid stabilization module